MADNRREESARIRASAAALARERIHPEHRNNGDEQRFANDRYAMSFTKGLEHDAATGLLESPSHFEAFRKAVDEAVIDAFTTSVPVSAEKERAWEAPTAGVVYELEGPDPQAVTMAPAPALGSAELAYEMAEVYELAALRDVPLADFAAGSTNADVAKTIANLEKLDYAQEGFPNRPRRTAASGLVDAQTLFRGSSPGVEVGPYVSQFLWIGNAGHGAKVGNGQIGYGVLPIDQRVPIAAPKDWMKTPSDWLEVQNGKNTRDDESLFAGGRRFICVPRDLATYVHDDALYEAYLNACLILLGMRTPFDPAFDALSGGGKAFRNVVSGGHFRFEEHPREAGGFALYGGPHILTLVTEVATRALKAVRYQKFNNHMRLRPEALAGRLHFADEIAGRHPALGAQLQAMRSDLADSIAAARNASGSKSDLLPMAFQEGSPMHPAYGAGHATVAGACVTILKAFFDTSAVFVRRTEKPDGTGKKKTVRDAFLRSTDDPKITDLPIHYVPNAAGSELEEVVGAAGDAPLTLEGELNKLAANISIGRNMAGVHYFSDYYDSARMGEEIAIGILEEQALCYPTDPFVMTVPTFDGRVVRIGER